MGDLGVLACGGEAFGSECWRVACVDDVVGQTGVAGVGCEERHKDGESLMLVGERCVGWRYRGDDCESIEGCALDVFGKVAMERIHPGFVGVGPLLEGCGCGIVEGAECVDVGLFAWGDGC